jgi:hypothetical protein
VIDVSPDVRRDAGIAMLPKNVNQRVRIVATARRTQRGTHGSHFMVPKLSPALSRNKTLSKSTTVRRGVDAHIGDVVEPVAALLIEIRIIAKRPPVDKIVAEIADGPLDFALGLRPIGATRARREAPVVREPQKLEVAHERAALEAQVARDHGFHLIEEELLRDAAEIAKRVLEPIDQRAHVLAHVEPAPQQPRVAEHDEQRVPDAPRKREAREVDLRLSARGRFEADHRVRRRRRPDLADKRLQLCVTAGEPR